MGKHRYLRHKAVTHRHRWAAHPWQARGLRVLVYALPVAGSLLLLRLAVSITGTPTGSLWIFLVWWLAMSLAATIAVSVLYALARRLLPLGALLELSLVFPDEAPQWLAAVAGAAALPSHAAQRRWPAAVSVSSGPASRTA